MTSYIAKVERQINHQIKSIRSDNGGEFTSNQWQHYMSQRGIEHVKVPPGAHAQNGRVERAHLTILNGVHTLLSQTGLPAKFWAEAANYIVYCRNRSPSTNDKVPEELWRGKAVTYTHLQPFGCKAYFRDHRSTSKLETRYKEGLLVGYVEGTVNYRVWDLENSKIHQTRDVVFTKHQTTLLQNLQNFAKHNLVEFSVTNNRLDQSDGADNERLLPSTPSTILESNDPLDKEQIPIIDLQNLQNAQNVPILQNRKNITLDKPIGQEDDSDDELLLYGHLATTNKSSNIPNTYQQARNSSEGEQWQSAINDELAKMDKYNVWTVVDCQPNMRVIGARWVFTRKIDGQTGLPSTYKARWVAKGFSQVEGLDFNELFASVAHKDSNRLFLSVVNHLDLECDQVDITAAFLNGDLEETIYLNPPEGSNIGQDKVLLLRKSLYGLKQSPRCFNKRLDKWLQSQGLVPTAADPCVYTRRHNGHFLMLSVHVDDQLIACDQRSVLNDFKRALNSEFECKDSGPVSYFLGFNVIRDRANKTLQISQQHYFTNVLEQFGMLDCNPVSTPLPANFKPIIATDEEFAQAKQHPYAQVVGSILYAATVSRPDLAHAASVLSGYISKWNDSHWFAAKHLLRYIKGTLDLSLTFSDQPMSLAFADADWGGDMDTHRSTTGYLFKVFGGAVAWKSRRQPTVALSTTEAEYMASADASRQAIWIRLFLDNLGLGLGDKPLQIYNDNAGTVSLAKNPVHHERTKHIALRHHFIREKVEDGTVSLHHIATENNLADLLTKYLPRETFGRLCKGIGLIPRSV